MKDVKLPVMALTSKPQRNASIGTTDRRQSQPLTIGALCQAISPLAQGQESRIEESDFFVVTGRRGPCSCVSRYRQMRYLPTSLFPEDWNELVRISVDEAIESSLLRVVPGQILILTNQSLCSDRPGQGLRQWRYLRCRYSTDRKSGMNNRSGLIRRISYDEIPFQAQASFRARSLRIPEETLRRAWLGSFERELGAISTKYTIGDAFCGAGGVSRGAALAGLAVSWGFDVDAIVGMSYLSNFPQATFHQVDAQHFHTTPDVHVDVLHLSPSCQAFSAMNTTEDGGQHGEYNRDSFLSCLAVVKHVRPRIVTMEQVPGILFARSSAYFNNFVRDLVDIGFSVRWDVLACEHFGVPQTRKRLFLIASCPGHSLPSLPTATGHASKVNDYLHRSAQRTEFADRWHETITTKGGLALDGSRLTIAELQAIQAFPYNHIFQGTDAQIRRQIGNAVPPQLARCIFMQVLDCLREVDRGDTILIE